MATGTWYGDVAVDTGDGSGGAVSNPTASPAQIVQATTWSRAAGTYVIADGHTPHIIRCQTSFSLAGTLDADGAGYAGGQPVNADRGSGRIGSGPSGGGPAEESTQPTRVSTGGGGGGSFGTAGAAGTGAFTPINGGHLVPVPLREIIANLLTALPQGGGGGGSTVQSDPAGTAGTGGRSGGLVVVVSPLITVSGSALLRGLVGTGATPTAAGTGGSGLLVLIGQQVNLDGATVNVTSPGSGGSGGKGGDGALVVLYVDTYSAVGATLPTATHVMQVQRSVPFGTPLFI